VRSRAFVGVGAAGVALGTVALACAFLPITSGCQGHQCDYSEADFGLQPGEGALVPNDPNTWESVPIDGTWSPYPHFHKTKFFLPFVPAAQEIVDVQVFISPDAKPWNNNNTTFTIAAGNLAELQIFPPFMGNNDPRLVDKPYVTVFNATCDNFYVRTVIKAAPRSPGADAGRDAADDAPTDADEGGN
jgi:hypothetical protein